MEWTKENLYKIYLEKFGITLLPKEIDYLWDNKKSITPEGDKMNIAVSPLFIKGCIERELQRTGLKINDPRFKKVREEIIPAIDFTLFLKKLGFGEHLITSSDSPDIILINQEHNSIPGIAYKKRAIPLEITFINDFALKNTIGSDAAEKIVKIIEINKLNKRYDPHTTLLVVIDTIFYNLNLQKVTDLLKDKVKSLHAITLWINEGGAKYLMADVYPKLTTWDINPQKDLNPLMY